MAMSDNTRGALLMVGSMTAFTVNDAFIKSVFDELPLFQAIFLRSLGTVAVMALLARVTGGLRLPAGRRDRWLLLGRSLAEAVAAWLFLKALFHMPLANVSAILQALPLCVTLAGALFFGEAIGWRRLTAILVGFLGVLLIVRPGTEGFTIYSVYALLTVAVVTYRDLAARRMSAAVPSLTVAFMGAAMITLLFGIGAAFIDWQPVSAKAAGQLTGSCLFVVAAYILSVATMRVGEIGAIAPFRYTSLVVALILGFLVFGDWPAPLTLLGAAIVVGTGLFTWARERGSGRRPPAVTAVTAGAATGAGPSLPQQPRPGPR
jgi:S-adenosylmethionine uptake transporter